jgi:hypothetical protein
MTATSTLSTARPPRRGVRVLNHEHRRSDTLNALHSLNDRSIWINPKIAATLHLQFDEAGVPPRAPEDASVDGDGDGQW